MIGNPLIADAVVQPGGVVVITAKSYGATNLVALDRTGATLSDIRSRWLARPTESSWSIAASTVKPIAACRIASAASPSAIRPAYFTANLGQLGTFSAQAQGGGAAPAEIAALTI